MFDTEVIGVVVDRGIVVNVESCPPLPPSLPNGDPVRDPLPAPTPDNELEATPDVDPIPDADPGEAGILPFPNPPSSSPASNPEPNNTPMGFPGEAGLDGPAAPEPLAAGPL